MLVMLQNPYLLDPHNWTKLLPFLTFTMDFSNSQLVDGPLWTLAVECQYYLMLPLIALAIYGLTRLVRPEKRLWVVLCSLFVIIAWGMALRYIANQPSLPFPGSRTTLNTLLSVFYGEKGKFPEDFAVGMLAAVLYVFFKNAPDKDKYLRIMQRLSPWLGVVSVLLFVCAAMRSYSIADGYAWPIAPGVFRIFPWTFDLEIDFALSYGCCIMAALFDRPGGFFRRLFEWNPLRWVGTLTFSLYIWHVPFILILQQNIGPGLLRMNHYAAILLCWILVLSISLPFCFIMYVTIEKPNMHLSERLRQWLLLKKRIKTQAATLPCTPLPQERDNEQTLQIQDHFPSDTNSQVGVAMEWLSANTYSEQWTRGPQLSPAQTTNRFSRNKHRLQPLPVGETGTPKN